MVVLWCCLSLYRQVVIRLFNYASQEWSLPFDIHMFQAYWTLRHLLATQKTQSPDHRDQVWSTRSHEEHIQRPVLDRQGELLTLTSANSTTFAIVKHAINHHHDINWSSASVISISMWKCTLEAWHCSQKSPMNEEGLLPHNTLIQSACKHSPWPTHSVLSPLFCIVHSHFLYSHPQSCHTHFCSLAWYNICHYISRCHYHWRRPLHTGQNVWYNNFQWKWVFSVSLVTE